MIYTKKMRNFRSFSTVSHLYYSGKRFKNYAKNIARSENDLCRDRKLTATYREVSMHVESNLNTMFFTDGNPT